MADPAFATARHVDELTDVALDGLPVTDVDRVEDELLAESVVEIDGYCPFLTCLKTGPHTHPVCPACGAVRYGNLFCTTCSDWHAAHPGARPEVDE